MKKIILSIILIILIIAIIVLTYIKFFVYIQNDSKGSTTDNVNMKPVYKSYKLAAFDESGNLIETNNNNNYYINIGDTLMSICTYDPDMCDSFEYEKKDDKYVMITDYQKLLDANIEIFDDENRPDDGIKVIKKYEKEGIDYIIFYFKKEMN